jgi:hypothetical protein
MINRTSSRQWLGYCAMAGLLAILAEARSADAQGARPIKKCPADAVIAGTVCMDAWEASVWRVTDPMAVKAIRAGKATAAGLIAAGGVQLGTTGDDYAPCADSGQNCVDDIFAVSLPGVPPSADITWFQALAACENSRKRLPTSAEWQAAVAGTPDPGPDNGSTDCNTASTFAPVATGSRTSCVSARGAHDMVGNVYEWVADWEQRSTTCGTWSPTVSSTNDAQCLAGAHTTGEPGALLRGGGPSDGVTAGPLEIVGSAQPSLSVFDIGFRCAR